MGLKQSKDEPTKIDMQMTQAMTERAQSGHFTIKSFNSIIMKFPKIDESFGEVRSVFKKFGKMLMLYILTFVLFEIRFTLKFKYCIQPYEIFVSF